MQMYPKNYSWSNTNMVSLCKSEICFLALAFPSRNWLKGRLADNCRNPIYFPVKTCVSWCFPFRFSLNQSIVPRKTSLILSGVACCVQGLKRAKSLCPSFANGSGKPSDLVVACFVGIWRKITNLKTCSKNVGQHMYQSTIVIVFLKWRCENQGFSFL